MSDTARKQYDENFKHYIVELYDASDCQRTAVFSLRKLRFFAYWMQK